MNQNHKKKIKIDEDEQHEYEIEYEQVEYIDAASFFNEPTIENEDVDMEQGNSETADEPNTETADEPGPTRKRALKTKDDQYEAMTEFMEEHPAFATGRLKAADGKGTMEKMWAKLSAQLNALGPPVKTPDKWKKVIV